MYLNFFNLKREPFNITPDPGLLYLSPSHKEALGAVIYGVNKRKGFVAIVGEVGVGKTTIIRSFLDRIDKQNVRTIYIFNANISFKALLKTIYQNLRCVPQTDDVSEMVDQLHMILIDEYKAGHNVVLIIDEAQNMPVETLENLRMLSNLETSTDKLIQIVFSGQPEFEQRLNVHALRQLRQRIAIRVKIMPLSRAESLAYIDFRLSKSLMNDSCIFTRGALDQIVGAAGGIPRIINVFCDNCLVTSFGNQQKRVTSKVAREIIAEQTAEKKIANRWLIPVISALVVFIFVFCVCMKYGLPVRVYGPAVTDSKPDSAFAARNTVKAVSSDAGTTVDLRHAEAVAKPVGLPVPVPVPSVTDRRSDSPVAERSTVNTVSPAPAAMVDVRHAEAAAKPVVKAHKTRKVLKGHKVTKSENKANYTNSETDRIIAEARSRLFALELNEQELLNKYTENNRLVVDNRKQMEIVKGFIKEQGADIGP